MFVYVYLSARCAMQMRLGVYVEQLDELLLSSTTTAKNLQWDVITMLLVLQNKCDSPIRISRRNISLVNVVQGGGKDSVLFDHYQALPNPVARVCTGRGLIRG